MAFSTSSEQPLRWAPPLAVPLRLLPPLGLFGMPRFSVAPLPWPAAGAACIDATADYAAEHELLPSFDEASEYLEQGTHEGVDLAAPVGTCVFAVRDGVVVESQGERIALDHHPTGDGLLTRYLHLGQRYVEVGSALRPTIVRKGQLIGSVGPLDPEPHLHFELLHNVPMAGLPQEANDLQTLPLDPTRPLFSCDQDRELATGAPRPEVEGLIVGVRTYDWKGLPFFRVWLKLARREGSVGGVDRPREEFDVPLYEPSSTAELELVRHLRADFEAGRKVRLRYRKSAFWGNDPARPRQLVLSARTELE